MFRLTSCLAVLVAVSLFASSASAIEFGFTGIVDSLDASLAGEFSVGESVVGSYVVDEDNGHVQSSRVIYPASDLIVTVGDDYTLTATTGSVIVAPDTWFLVSFSGVSAGFSGDPVGGSSPEYFDIQLNDDNALLELGVLPLEYQIDQFGLDRSNINFPDDSNRLDFTVESIGVVPEPSTILLLAVGALGFLAHGWRRRRAA